MKVFTFLLTQGTALFVIKESLIAEVVVFIYKRRETLHVVPGRSTG